MKAKDFLKEIKVGKKEKNTVASFKDFLQQTQELKLRIPSEAEMSNEFVKSHFVQSAIELFEDEIEFIAESEQSEAINVCSEEFVKSVFYLQALKKGTKGKFEK